jgi:hypothetical protein
VNTSPSISHSDLIGDSGLYGIYKGVKYLSIKHSSYFPVYERLFEKYIGTDVTFVEVGVLNGGSLFMWREFFGLHVVSCGTQQSHLASAGLNG